MSSTLPMYFDSRRTPTRDGVLVMAETRLERWARYTVCGLTVKKPAGAQAWWRSLSIGGSANLFCEEEFHLAEETTTLRAYPMVMGPNQICVVVRVVDERLLDDLVIEAMVGARL